MAQAPHLLRVRARQDIRHVGKPQAEAALLLDPEHGRQEFAGGFRCIEHLTRREAVVAGAAVLGTKLLAEVAQQGPPAALAARREALHLRQLLPRDLALL